MYSAISNHISNGTKSKLAEPSTQKQTKHKLAWAMNFTIIDQSNVSISMYQEFSCWKLEGGDASNAAAFNQNALGLYERRPLQTLDAIIATSPSCIVASGNRLYHPGPNDNFVCISAIVFCLHRQQISVCFRGPNQSADDNYLYNTWDNWLIFCRVWLQGQVLASHYRNGVFVKNFMVGAYSIPPTYLASSVDWFCVFT